LRAGGVAVFWSPDRCRWFEKRLAAVFARTVSVAASDIVQDRIHECTLYVGIREG
jgi:hypothetical protein